MNITYVNRLATILACIVAVVGGVTVVTNDLSYKEYFESITVMFGLLGIGYGLDKSSTP